MADTGYSAPFVLQDILAQKRAVQHQKLVDSLNLVQQQSSMEDAAKGRQIQQQQLQDNAGYRNDQLAESKADRASREKIAMAPARVQQPSIVEEFEYAKNNGFKGTFGQYQNEDANRKRLNVPAGPQAQLFQAPDPNDPTKMVSHWLKPGDQPSEANRINGLAIRKGNEAPGSTGDGPKPAEFINLSKLAKKATAGPARMFGMRDGKPADPGDVAAYNQALNSIVARTKADPAVIEGVLASLDEDPSIPTSKIIQDQIAANPDATPEEIQQFKMLVTIARGR